MTTVASADYAPALSAATSRGWGDRGLVFVIAFALAVNTIGLGWGLPAGGKGRPWELDGIGPVEPLAAAKRMFVDRWWNSGFYRKYPLGHYFVLMAATAPYVGYLWLTGDLGNLQEEYPFGFTDPDRALSVLTRIIRATSALMGVGIVILVYLMVRRLAGRQAALFSALTIACSPAFIFYAHTTNIDTPSLFWSALGLFAFVRLVQGVTSTRNYLLLGFAAGMAAATKEQTVGLFLLVPLSILVLHAQRQAPASFGAALLRAPADRGILAGFGASLLTFVAATHLVFNWDGNVMRFRWRLFGEHPKFGEDHPYGRPEVAGVLDALVQATVNTVESMNPLLFAAGLVGLVTLVWSRRWARHLAVPLASYLLFAVGLFAFFRARFVMQLVLVLAIFAGPVLATLWRWAAARGPALVAPLLALWVYTLAYGLETNMLLLRDSRYAAESWLRTVPSGARVETFGNVAYLPRLPRDLDVRHSQFTLEDLTTLDERAPEYLVFTLRYRNVSPDSDRAELVARLLRGDGAYRPIQTFTNEPWLAPRLIPGLSPEIVILARSPVTSGADASRCGGSTPCR
jgi:hypothetical protein